MPKPPSFFNSSKGNVSAQRANGILETFGSGAAILSPIAAIPFKFSQLLVSLYLLCNKDIFFAEKTGHGLQAVLSGTMLGLLIALLMEGQSCEETVNLTNSSQPFNLTSTNDPTFTLCSLVVLFNLLYKGFLGATWTLAEATNSSYFYKHSTDDSAENIEDKKREERIEI